MISLQNCPEKLKKATYEETISVLAACDPNAVVKTPAETAKGALANLASMNSDRLGKSFKQIKSKSKAIEAELGKDVVDKINKSVPKGTKLDAIDDKQLEKDLKSDTDPEALAKKMKLDPAALDFFGK